MLLLLVVFVEPPNRFWAAGGEPSDDRRPAWLVVALLVAVPVTVPVDVPDGTGLGGGEETAQGARFVQLIE